MKKWFLFILLTLLCVNSFAQNKVALLSPVGDVPNEIKTVLLQELSTALTNCGNYTQIEQEIVANKIATSGFVLEKDLSNSQLTSVGASVEANFICHTIVTLLGSNYYVHCKLVNVETGKLEIQKSGITQQGMGDLLQVILNVANSLFEKQNNNVLPSANSATKPKSPEKKLFSFPYMDKEVFVMPHDISSTKVNWREASNVCSNSKYGDFEDWRLPTKNEIAVLYSNKSKIGRFKYYWYWSGTRQGNEYYRQAFDEDKIEPANPNAELYVRCVRSEQLTSEVEFPSIEVFGKELVVMPYDISETKKVWSEAEHLCSASEANGFSDWRLPTKIELRQIYLNKAIIKNFNPYWYWSSTSESEEYYRQAFDADRVGLSNPKDLSHVRCVRSGELNENIKLPTVNVLGNNVVVMPENLESNTVTWKYARITCDKLSAYGFNDWRLPSVTELFLINENSTSANLFGSEWYWSSVRTGNGLLSFHSEANKFVSSITNEAKVRCVRDGDTNSTTEFEIKEINCSGSQIMVMPAIILPEVTVHEARGICLNAKVNDIDTWRLPSSEELDVMFVSKNELGMQDKTYWSETVAGVDMAFTKNFKTGKKSSSMTTAKKSFRCVKTK